MTAAFLQSELASLISDSKRKYSDVRAAAEKSLVALKAVQVTSETQLAADLFRRPQFIDPFILACKTHNVKLASSGAVALQRLIASTAVAKSRLSDTLAAFQTAAPLALEIQLKVLQTLPSLLQLYANDLHGGVLAKTLSISADLSASKSPLVSNTASATFQQLITTVFESLADDDFEASADQGIQSSSHDALSVFRDLCARVRATEFEFVHLESLSLPLTIGSIESPLTNYGPKLTEALVAKQACESLLLPGIVDTMADSLSFSAVVRSMRVVYLLTTQHLHSYHVALQPSLTCLVKLLDRSNSNKWKRAAAFEFWRGVCVDFNTFRNVFYNLDLKPDSDSKGTVAELMSTLVRTSTEDPALIGLSRQSTVPTQRGPESSGVTDPGLVDFTGASTGLGSVSQAGADVTGISSSWSNVTIPVLEQVDKESALEIPDTYIFTIVLSCVAAFSDGVSKFLMPLSVPPRKVTKADDSGDDTDAENDTRPKRQTSVLSANADLKYQQLINPLNRDDLGESTKSQVQICAKMIDECWPAVLATCSTFLNAALDSHYYHILVRTVQKLTQVSGVLALHTPRDALMTTLAKVCVPANVSNIMNALYGQQPAKVPPDSNDIEEVSALKSPASEISRQSLDLSQSLNVRNLLCLRALLNLGIALGPTFGEASWIIIFQALEQVEALTSVGPTVRIAAASNAQNTQNRPGNDATSSLASELAAIDTARRRMIESTKSYSNQAFLTVAGSMFRMVEDIFPRHAEEGPNHVSLAPEQNSKTPRSNHKPTRSVSGNWAKTLTLEVEVQFVLKTIGRLLFVNLFRLVEPRYAGNMWTAVMDKLLAIQLSITLQPQLRSQAADIVDALIVEISKASNSESFEDVVDVLKSYALPALYKQLECCINSIPSTLNTTQIDMHHRLIETLENVVSHCGDNLESGWEVVFEILETTIKDKSAPAELYSASFKVTQLILSDFLSVLHVKSIDKVLQLLFLFSKQSPDLNISLTAIALFWSVNSGILGQDVIMDKAPDRALKSILDPPANLKSSDVVSYLWWQAIISLAQLCDDIRVDVRNASIRVLMKITEASLRQMRSSMFNSYLSEVLFPAARACIDKERSADREWRDSSLTLLDSGVSAIKMDAGLLLQDSRCKSTIQLFVETVQHICTKGQLADMTRALTLLAAALGALRTSQHSQVLNADGELLSSVWSVAMVCGPGRLTSEKDSNSGALAARISVLLEIASFEAANTVNTDDSISVIAETLSLARLSAYEKDINKMTNDQARVVDLLRLLSTQKNQSSSSFVQDLLKIINREFESTVALHTPEIKSKSNSGKATSHPTKIAFLSACLDLLRDHISEVLVTSATSWTTLPISKLLQMYQTIVATKYSGLPTSEANPLWKNAVASSAKLMTLIREAFCRNNQKTTNRNTNHVTVNNSTTAYMGEISEEINQLIENILGIATEEHERHLPSTEALIKDQEFESNEFRRIHRAAVPLIEHSSTTFSSKKEYILILFRHSLVAEPWYNDLTPDLENEPLHNFTHIRLGSIRKPNLLVRRNIWLTSLEALFSLVSIARERQSNAETKEEQDSLSTLAAPYVLLRIAHTLKTFITDQRLRGLNPPHRALQAELNIVLSKAVSLRVRDSAFANIVIRGHEYAARVEDDSGSEGKTLLKMLYPLVVEFTKTWRDLPRLRKGLAWQDDPDGQAAEESLQEWEEVLREAWGPKFG